MSEKSVVQAALEELAVSIGNLHSRVQVLGAKCTPCSEVPVPAQGGTSNVHALQRSQSALYAQVQEVDGLTRKAAALLDALDNMIEVDVVEFCAERAADGDAEANRIMAAIGGEVE